MNREIRRKVVDVFQYDDRINSFILDTKPVDTFILQVYMPTSTRTDEEVN